jgi:outer membrane protein assembly factor BamB
VLWGSPKGDAVDALNADTGRIVWSYRTAGEDMPSPVYVRLPGKDLLIFSNGDEHVRALDPLSGRLVWETKQIGVSTMSSLAEQGGIAYGASNLGQAYNLATERGIRYPFRSRTWAIRASDGQFIWMTPFGNSDCSPTIGDNEILMEATDRTRPLETGDPTSLNSIAAINAFSGKIDWLDHGGAGPWDGGLGTDEEATAGVFEAGVYYSAEQFSRTFSAFDIRTGRTLWTYRTDGSVKMGAVLYRGSLYFGDANGNLYVVDARDGSLIRRASFAKPFGASPPVIVGDSIFFANGDMIYAVPLEKLGSGKEP